MATTDNDVIEHIAQQIDQLARSIYTEHSDMLAAKDELDGKNDELKNKRMALCADIARIADEDDWSDESIKQAVSMAIARIKGNTPAEDKTSKAMQVFASQIALPAHQAVRSQFDTMTSVIRKAWEAEQEQAKKDKKDGRDIDTPIKKFVSREYELVLRACREVIKPSEYGRKLDDPNDRLRLRTPKDVEVWARANDPDMDAVKVAGKLDAMVKQLKAMAVIFADTDQHALHIAAQTLAPWVGSGDTKGTKLRMSKSRADAARARASQPETETVDTIEPTPEPVSTPVHTPEPVTATEPMPEQAEPLPGVFSIDETMNDAQSVIATELERLAA